MWVLVLKVWYPSDDAVKVGGGEEGGVEGRPGLIVWFSLCKRMFNVQYSLSLESSERAHDGIWRGVLKDGL